MKPVSVLFFALTAAVLTAADLTTGSGTVYKNFSVTGVTRRGVSIEFADGAANVPLSELPDDLRKKYSASVAKKQADAQMRADAVLDQQRGCDAEPVAEIRAKLQKVRNAERTITVCGKYGRKYEKCRIQHIGAEDLTVKLNDVSARIPFRRILNMTDDGMLSAPSFSGTVPDDSGGQENSGSAGSSGASGRATVPERRTIYTGSRGGIYYYNSKGRKVYLRKR